MSLADELKALKGKLAAENDLGGQKDTAKIADLEQQIADLNIQILAENQQVEAELRVQEQEEKVEAIQLPYDFSEVFQDPRANDIIIELIKDLQRQTNAAHNEELAAKETAHLEELRQASARELELKRKLDELQTKNEAIEKQVYEHINTIRGLEVDLKTAKDEAEDANEKLDAAVKEKEGLELLVSEKQSHIDKLRDEIAIGAKAAVHVTEISTTDRLAQLVEASKQAKVKSALDIALENTAPFRGKVIPGAVAELQTPEVQPFPTVNQTDNTTGQLDSTEPQTILAADQPVNFILPATPEGAFRAEEGTVPAPSEGLDTSNATAAGKSVEERLAALEKAVFGE